MTSRVVTITQAPATIEATLILRPSVQRRVQHLIERMLASSHFSPEEKEELLKWAGKVETFDEEMIRFTLALILTEYIYPNSEAALEFEASINSILIPILAPGVDLDAFIEEYEELSDRAEILEEKIKMIEEEFRRFMDQIAGAAQNWSDNQTAQFLAFRARLISFNQERREGSREAETRLDALQNKVDEIAQTLSRNASQLATLAQALENRPVVAECRSFLEGLL